VHSYTPDIDALRSVPDPIPNIYLKLNIHCPSPDPEIEPSPTPTLAPIDPSAGGGCCLACGVMSTAAWGPDSRNPNPGEQANMFRDCMAICLGAKKLGLAALCDKLREQCADLPSPSQRTACWADLAPVCDKGDH
jgi:hypothetical protein